MSRITIMNLEDLVLASVTMYVLDNIAKRATFYNKKLDLKEYMQNNLEKEFIKLSNDEFVYFDIVGDFFSKVCNKYIEDYKDDEKSTIVLKLTKQLRKDFRDFVKKHSADIGGNKFEFGALGI